MVGCSVGVCKSSSSKHSQMVLFPKEVNRNLKWEEFCSRGENFEASESSQKPSHSAISFWYGWLFPITECFGEPLKAP